MQANAVHAFHVRKGIVLTAPHRYRPIFAAHDLYVRRHEGIGPMVLRPAPMAGCAAQRAAISASFITKNAVDSASACAAVGARAHVRWVRVAGARVRGSRRCEPFTAIPEALSDAPAAVYVITHDDDRP